MLPCDPSRRFVLALPRFRTPRMASRIVRRPGRGRCLVASRALERGDLVLGAELLAVQGMGSSMMGLRKRCSNAFLAHLAGNTSNGASAVDMAISQPKKITACDL